MSNKQFEDDDHADSLKYTEREYKALKKENVQLKQAVEDDCADRKREITGELNASKLKDKCLALLNSHASSSSTPSRPIESLPPVARVHDPCLIALFKQLPPADQLTARKVCSRWTDLVTYAARSTHSLAILVGDNSMENFAVGVNIDSLGFEKVVSLLKKEDGQPMFPLERFNKWNTLLYEEGLDETTVQAITATFINLDTLQIGFFSISPTHLEKISRLLELFSHHELTTLKLYEQSRYCIDFESPLIVAINGISTLKNLHLDLNTFPYHDLPIISQLEQLHVKWKECWPHQFADLLRRRATTSTTLRRIEYLSHNPSSDIEDFRSLDDHLLSCFTRFGITSSPHYNPQLLSTHFRHLTSLYIYPIETSLTRYRLFDHLSQLTQLLYLHLELNFSSLLPDDQPHLLLSQLKSVKALRLVLTIHSHRDLEQLKIGWTMPNVEAIEFNFSPNSKCTDCTIEEFGDFKVNLTTAQHCFRHMFTTLKANCTKLRAILHKHEDTLGSAEELLAE